MVATKTSPRQARTTPPKTSHPVPVKMVSLKRARGRIFGPPNDIEKYLHRPLPPIPLTIPNHPYATERGAEALAPQSAPATTTQFEHPSSPLAAVLASGAAAQHSRRRSQRLSAGHGCDAIRSKHTRSESNLRGRIDVIGPYYNQREEDAARSSGHCAATAPYSHSKRVPCLTISPSTNDHEDDVEDYPWVIGQRGVAVVMDKTMLHPPTHYVYSPDSNVFPVSL
ncbi:hypothetical protein BOTBODRAFT_144943 [Botryobasidium botryosum FD-172 SS1]|uniref:Uncharacterized protein n=1 Tax=Botryobasidium botryosum (strain FD-172 SS1) TaxID=930990 RepID=A0A067MWM5_BOTB1|nr:hypothetical protein BOTBODRAFT_144943 [Botryobasidium botryosum FD-172 SS1]